jgi:predicted Zn-dependent protease
MIPESQAIDILQRGLSHSRADQTEMVLIAERRHLTRFAESIIHQNMSRVDHTAMCRAVLGNAAGVSVTNDLSDGAIKKLVDEARQIAQEMPRDPDFPALVKSPPAQKYSGHVKKTAQSSPLDRAETVEKIVKIAGMRNLACSGAFDVKTTVTAVCNSLDTRQYFDETTAHLSLTVSNESGRSGWSQWFTRDVEKIDVEQVAEAAVQKGITGDSLEVMPPGQYTVILEEAAVASLLLFLAFLGFGGKTLVQGRSFMSRKIGEQITGENITIVEDPFNPAIRDIPFDYEGVPKKSVILIENGIARGGVYNRYYAKKAEVESTGHALPPNNPYGPYPKAMVMSPGEATMEEMIASTERGILVTHFWYMNFLNPMRTMVTASTRDGTFLIEKGKLTSPLEDMRIAQSILEALSNCEMLTRERRLCPQFGSVMYVPAMKIKNFNFTEVET